MFSLLNKFVVVALFIPMACSESVDNRGGRSANQGEFNPEPTPTPTPTPSPTPASKKDLVCPKYPVLFQHGLGATEKNGYFLKVVEHYTALSCKVAHAKVAPFATSEVRAASLKEQAQALLAETKAEKINIIAHSQGGLDARYMISKLDMAGSVASLTTLGTPHRGTKIADLFMSATADPAQAAIAKSLLESMTGIKSEGTTISNEVKAAMQVFTTAGATAFNAATPDQSGVYYQSWAGNAAADAPGSIPANFAAALTFLTALLGPNDGLVSVESAKWGKFRSILPAHHMAMIGNNLPTAAASSFKHLDFLDDVVTELNKLGY